MERSHNRRIVPRRGMAVVLAVAVTVCQGTADAKSATDGEESGAPFLLSHVEHVSYASSDVRVGAAPEQGTTAGVTEAPVVGSSGAALVITATFDSSITTDPNSAAIEAAINNAINIHQSRFNDPIAVSILFRYSTTYANGTTSLPSGALSVSQAGAYAEPWNTYINALTADATTANDATANASLPGSALSTNVTLSSANGRAVGLNTPPAMFANGSVGPGGPYDGIVTLNASKVFNFTRPATSGMYDAQRSTEHELDEVLGFGSYLNAGGSDLRPQDLFSWSAAGVRNLMSSGARYFSIDSGNIDIVDFNQDPSGDFGDWLSGACPQATPYVQNAFSCTDQASDVTVTSPEGINLDVIGYDLITSTSTTTNAPTTTTSGPSTTTTTHVPTTTTTMSTTTTSGPSTTTTTNTSTTSPRSTSTTTSSTTTGPSTTTSSTSTTTGTTSTTTLVTVLPPSACPDAPAAAAVEAAIEAQCNCRGAANHGTFVRCATHLAKASTLPKRCKRAAIDCAARSVCGKPGFVTCCRTTGKGKTTCSIKSPAAHCKATKHGTACVGQRPSCCDACGSGGCAAADPRPQLP